MIRLITRSFLYAITLVVLFSIFPMNVSAVTIYPSEEEAVKEEITALEEKMEQPGTYRIRLKFKRDGKVVETVIYCTIKGENTVVVDGIAIDANSIRISQDKVGVLTKDDWIRLAQAQAWQTKDGTVLPIESVEDQAIKKKLGSYPLTFKTVQKVKTTVMVEVVEDLEALYQKNDAHGWFQSNKTGEELSWFPFNHVFLSLMRVTLFFLLLLPLLALLIQYLFATKLVKQVVALITK